MQQGSKVVIQPHDRHAGIFIINNRVKREQSIATLNMVPGVAVYSEKLVPNDDKTKEYREWNPFRSKLGATIVGGVKSIHMGPGSKVLYLGAANGTTVSHVSDLLGPEGVVYAVEFSHRSGRELVDLAKARPNIIPIVADARKPNLYRMLVPMVDAIFSDVAQPDQSRIVVLNAEHFLKQGGHALMSVKANCVDSTVDPEVVFQGELDKLREGNFKAREMLSLEPYERDHCVLIGQFRAEEK